MRRRAVRIWQSRAVLWTSIGVMAVVAVCAAVVALMPGGKPASKASTVAGRSVAARAPQGPCNVPAGDQRVPLDPPAAHWDKVGDYQAPGSTIVGPGLVRGHLRACWAHSPTGAIFAAYNYAVVADQYGTDVGLLRRLTARGALRDEGLREGGTPRSDPSKRVEIIGFRVLDHTSSEITILLGARVVTAPSAEMDLGQTGSQLVQIPMRMRWEDGDWRYVVDPTAKAEPMTGVAGLVFWSKP